MLVTIQSEPFVFSSRIYKTIILPVVLYGCETLSQMLRGKCRLKVFENRVLMRIFGHERVEMEEG
jgi:hypothetical protein